MVPSDMPRKSKSNVDWKTLKTPYGHAGKLPTLVKRMTTCREDDGGEREVAHRELTTSLVSDGQWCEASVPVMALVLDSLQQAMDPQYHLALLAQIVSGGCMVNWLGKVQGSSDPVRAECERLLQARKGELLGMIAAPRAECRAGVALLLGMLTELAQDSVPLLAAQWAAEESAEARASILVALDNLDASGEWPTRVDAIATGGDKQKLVLGAAALCWLRRHRTENVDRVGAGIAAWLSVEWQDAIFLPWYREQNQWRPKQALEEVLVLRQDPRDSLVKVLIGICSLEPPNVVLGSIGQVLGPLIGMDGSKGVLELEELTQDQRVLANALADSPAFGNATWMPASGPPRRRWLGLAPPGPLERRVEVFIEGKRRVMPAWKAWTLLEAKGEYCDEIPTQLWELYTPRERWQALVEMCSGAYQSECFISRDTVESLVAQLPVDEETTRIAVEMGNTMVTSRSWWCPTEWVSGVLLLPFVRAQLAIPESLWCQLYFDRHWLNHEIAAGIPQHYLRLRVQECLEKGFERPSFGWGMAAKCLSVLDLIPEPPICQRLVQLINSLSESAQRSMRESVEEKVAGSPQLKALLNGAQPAATKSTEPCGY